MMSYLDDLSHRPLADLDPAGQFLVQLLLVPGGQSRQETGEQDVGPSGRKVTGMSSKCGGKC